MADLTIDEILQKATRAEYRARMVTMLVTLSVPADKWKSGGVASTMLTVCAALFAFIDSTIVGIISDFFLPLATGTGLVRLAYYVYGVTVPEATFATGSVTFTNSAGGIYPMAAGEVTVLNSSTGITYTNVDAVTIPALGTATVDVRATTAGSVGNSSPAGIDTMNTTLYGVTVTNPAALVGIDAPTDAAVRQLCTNKLGVLGVRGVRTAYAYAVQTATNSVTDQPVNINRWSISESSHTGTVTLYVASPTGVPDADDVTGVATNVEALARPAGVTANTYAAAAVVYAPTITVYVLNAPGLDVDALKDAIDAAILTYISTYPIGGVTASDDTNTAFTGLFGSGVASAIAAGCATLAVTLLSVKGATDQALLASEVITNSVTTIVVSVAQTSGFFS